MSLPTLTLLLVFCQALGALIGAVAVVWAELSYVRAVRRGKVDAAERAHLLTIGHGLRYGMTLLLLTSVGLIVESYRAHIVPQPALSASYWILIMLVLVVITVSSALARRRLSFKLASATLFAGWWFLVYLSFGWLALSFGAAVMSFLVAVVIFYLLLHITRFVVSPTSN